MKRHFAWAAAGALLAMGAGAAEAADLPMKAPPMAAPVMTYNWTGCYIGGNVGGGWAHTRQEFALTPFTGTLFSDSRGSDVIGGAQVGCDYQFDRFVIGAQGQFDFGRINSSAIEP